MSTTLTVSQLAYTPKCATNSFMSFSIWRQEGIYLNLPRASPVRGSSTRMASSPGRHAPPVPGHRSGGSPGEPMVFKTGRRELTETPTRRRRTWWLWSSNDWAWHKTSGTISTPLSRTSPTLQPAVSGNFLLHILSPISNILKLSFSSNLHPTDGPGYPYPAYAGSDLSGGLGAGPQVGRNPPNAFQLNSPLSNSTHSCEFSSSFYPILHACNYFYFKPNGAKYYSCTMHWPLFIADVIFLWFR